jgi:hypothetical protein
MGNQAEKTVLTFSHDEDKSFITLTPGSQNPHGQPQSSGEIFFY